MVGCKRINYENMKEYLMCSKCEMFTNNDGNSTDHECFDSKREVYDMEVDASEIEELIDGDK